MIVDAHVHVFLSASDDPERTVDVLAPPGREAPLEALERQMADAGVDAAVLVPLGPEDRYVSEVHRIASRTVRGHRGGGLGRGGSRPGRTTA